MKFRNLFLLAAGVASLTAEASMRPVIYVNPDVTTHILMPENIKLVDISTEKVVGDQCADNMLRIKPLIPDSILQNDLLPEGAFMGAVTLIGERHMAQYDLLYTRSERKAESIFKVTYDDTHNYSNPETPMTEGEMANYAWAISNSGRRFNGIRTKAYGIEAQIYNIYTIGDFFFIDLNLSNKTNIQYDIAQMRITLQDKKETKATNSQTLELTPAYVLNKETSFKKKYRQVFVLPKLTYPEEKVLNIEITEDQISGRVISIPVQYEDILNADCFNGVKEDAYSKVCEKNDELNKEIERLRDVVGKQQQQIDLANKRIKQLNGKVVKERNKYIVIEKEFEAYLKATRTIRKLRDDFGVSLADNDMLEDTDSSNHNHLSLDEF